MRRQVARGRIAPSLDDAGFPKTRLVVRGQGWRDQAEDVRRFHRAIADGWLAAPESLLLRHCLSVARLAVDPAGNQKIARHGPRTRDDAAVSLVMAVGEAHRRRNNASGGMKYAIT